MKIDDVLIFNMFILFCNFILRLTNLTLSILTLMTFWKINVIVKFNRRIFISFCKVYLFSLNFFISIMNLKISTLNLFMFLFSRLNKLTIFWLFFFVFFRFYRNFWISRYNFLREYFNFKRFKFQRHDRFEIDLTFILL